jgi:exopolyphosphatase/guanosine-5'-triphosphate,3'-diphosphate pyrophosphatase
MTRVAAIDCGTNSIRLLVADLGADGLRDVRREMRIVRLGQGVDRTGRLAEAALARTRKALEEYAATIRLLGASRIRMAATSATRDAANRSDFLAIVRDVLAVEPEVLTGLQEAELSYRGAVDTLQGLTAPVLVADIGGGSTELVLGSSDGSLQAHSMDVGSVRLTERHLHDDPPTREQAQAAVADIDAALDRAASDVPLTAARDLVGVAGTVTTLAAMAADLPRYDPAAIHGSRMSASEVARLTSRLLDMTHDERAAIPVIHPGRVDVITAGALVLRTLVKRTGARAVIASEHDILDGIALSLADDQRC